MRLFIKPLLIVIVSLLSLASFAIEDTETNKKGIPNKPSPARLVNIIPASAGPFSKAQIDALENDLVDFANSTSTQIVLVVVDNFQGYDKATFATELGHKWKVGQKGKDNGIVILLKPKEVGNGKGDVFIATGYGLEGVIPDAVAKRIVEFEMIPSFKQKDYYSGIKKGIVVLKGLALEEFTAKQYVNKRQGRKKGKGYAKFIIFGIFILLSLIFNRRKGNYYSPGHRVPFWTALFLGSSMRGGNNSWDDFSSGGGGFGGFGGGGFGGGGAGGSW